MYNSITILTLDNKPIVVPDSIRRKARLRRGERVEFRVSGRAITITPKEDDEYTPAERRAIGRAIAQSEKEYAAGLGRGPFATAEEFIADLHREVAKLDAKKRNRSRK